VKDTEKNGSNQVFSLIYNLLNGNILPLSIKALLAYKIELSTFLDIMLKSFVLIIESKHFISIFIKN